MKEQISAYITALIDMNKHTVDMSIENCLDNLLEFVMDIPEVDKERSITAFNLALGNKNIEKITANMFKRIMELEESCTHMCEVEKNLHKKIQGLGANNAAINETCNKLRDKNSSLLRINSSLAHSNENLRCGNSTQIKKS